jgi:uncharacterized protein
LGESLVIVARELKDKVIVITGASAGIGWATAVEAARAGMKCVISARREDRLNELAIQIEDIGGEALVVAADVGDPGAERKLVDQTMAKFGRLDVMFANAGYGVMKPIERMDEAEHRRIFEVNYFGCVRCVRAAIEVMKKAGSGHIVMTSSIVGRVGLPYYAAYSATKAAQAVLGMALRLEVEEYGIDVSTLHPIGTKTEFFDVSAKMGGREEGDSNTPDMFMQSPEHVARCVMKCLRRPREEIWPARWSHFASSMATWLPGVARRALRHHADKDRKLLEGGGVAYSGEKAEQRNSKAAEKQSR